jgi:putative ABC transport system permease protein
MRGAARQREMSMRLALGAGRWRLFQQLLIESLLVAVAGGVVGFSLACWGVPAIVSILPADFPLPRIQEISIDPYVLGLTMAVSLACGLVFGVLPALKVNPRNILDTLRDGVRHVTIDSGWPRSFLVVTEVALAMVLVIGAGLTLRSLLFLERVKVGFRPEGVLTVPMMVLPNNMTPQLTASVIDRMLNGVRNLPFVRAAAANSVIPLMSQDFTPYFRADRPEPPAGSRLRGDLSTISPGYFSTMGIPLLAGRDFSEHDNLGSPEVAILNQTAANELFPGEDPVGKVIEVTPHRPCCVKVQVVGVVADIRQRQLDSGPTAGIFLPLAQAAGAFMNLFVHVNGDPVAAIPAIREQIHAADPEQGTQEIKPMEQVVSDSIGRPKLNLVVFSIFGLSALTLACIGIYGVISYSVEQRRREIGIRRALGAAQPTILRLVLREGLGIVAVGILLGTIGALSLTRFLETMLFMVRPTDPVVFGVVTAVLALAALTGCYLPARRATRVDPMLVLRED